MVCSFVCLNTEEVLHVPIVCNVLQVYPVCLDIPVPQEYEIKSKHLELRID